MHAEIKWVTEAGGLWWQTIAGSLDGIIDTISAPHPLPDYLALLGLDGKLVVLGVPSEPLQLPTPSLIFGCGPCCRGARFRSVVSCAVRCVH